MITTKQILRALDCPHLNLYKGDGYHYFVYDNESANVWLDHSVYVYRLNHLTLEQWENEGREFLAVVATTTAEQQRMEKSTTYEKI